VNRPTRSVETIPCKLTVKEIIAKSQEQQSHLAKINELEKEAKGMAKYYKGEIEKAEKSVIFLSDQISTGREYREVECSITYDFDSKKEKVYRRVDTGETVRVVPISEFELQEELNFRAEEEAEGNTDEDPNGPDEHPESDTPYSEDENSEGDTEAA